MEIKPWIETAPMKTSMMIRKNSSLLQTSYTLVIGYKGALTDDNGVKREEEQRLVTYVLSIFSNNSLSLNAYRLHILRFEFPIFKLLFYISMIT
jgi:hypothetical protein